AGTFTTLTANTSLLPGTVDGINLGSATAEWNALYLGDDAGVYFGQDQNFHLYYDEASDDRLELSDGSNLFLSVIDQGTTADVSIGSSSPQNITSNADLTISGTIAQDSWSAPSFTNSWSNFGGAFSPAGYFRDKNGIVHLRGFVNNGTIGSAMFTLPAGYRPSYQEVHIALTMTSGLAYAYGRLDIEANGAVTSKTGGNYFVSLDGITFRANGY
ncbi:MAG: hypothetical protein ABIH71_05985, partial [Candidatus Omnitrophota bacterium]